MTQNNYSIHPTRSALEKARVVAVLRGDFRESWLDLAAQLVDTGFQAIEVTLTCPDALAGLKQLATHYEGKVWIGAGTVLTADEVTQSVDHGAKYIVAPNTNADVIARSIKHNVLAIPGAYTPTEIEFAYRLGAGIVKVFPSLPIGLDYIVNLRGPYPDIPIMCTGGLQPQHIVPFINAGANAVGITNPQRFEATSLRAQLQAVR